MSEGDDADITAIQWIDLLYSVVCSPPMINSGDAKQPLPPKLAEWVKPLMALPFEDRFKRVADAMVGWRIRRDGIKGWRMGADGAWKQIDE